MDLARTSEVKTHFVRDAYFVAVQIGLTCDLTECTTQKHVEFPPRGEGPAIRVEHEPTRAVDWRPRGRKRLPDQHVQRLGDFFKAPMALVRLHVFIQSTNFDCNSTVDQEIWWDVAIRLVHDIAQVLVLEVFENCSFRIIHRSNHGGITSSVHQRSLTIAAAAVWCNACWAALQSGLPMLATSFRYFP